MAEAVLLKALEAALYAQLATPATTLAGLVGTRVYNRLAPPTAALPFVVYQHQAGGDVNAEPVDRLEILFLVKGLAGTLGAAQDIDEAIRARLHNAALTITGWTCLSCMRDDEAQLVEVVNGAPIFHVGALYRIRVARA